MPVYAKLTKTTDPRFNNRATIILTEKTTDRIPIPNDVVLCNGCNSNIAETDKHEGYLVYLGKPQLRADQPYDMYCGDCLHRYFPKAIIEDNHEQG